MKRSREATFKDVADLIREVGDEARSRVNSMLSIVLRFEKESEEHPFRYYVVGFRQWGNEAWFNFCVMQLVQLVQSGGEPIGMVGFSDVPDRRRKHSYSKPFAEYSQDEEALDLLEQAANSNQSALVKIKQVVEWSNIKPHLN